MEVALCPGEQAGPVAGATPSVEALDGRADPCDFEPEGGGHLLVGGRSAESPLAT